jgi:hypothetical protein
MVPLLCMIKEFSNLLSITTNLNDRDNDSEYAGIHGVDGMSTHDL